MPYQSPIQGVYKGDPLTLAGGRLARAGVMIELQGIEREDAGMRSGFCYSVSCLLSLLCCDCGKTRCDMLL